MLTGESDTVMSKLVRKTLAECKLTPASKRKLAKLAGRPDSEIDFSDIPPLPDSFWKNTVRNPFYRPVKQQLTVRLDADIVAWLRHRQRLSDTAESGAPKSDAGRHPEERLTRLGAACRDQTILTGTGSSTPDVPSASVASATRS